MPGPPVYTSRPTTANKPIIASVIIGILGLGCWAVLSGESARSAQRAQSRPVEPIQVSQQPLKLPEAPPKPVPPPTPLEMPQPNHAPAPQILSIPPAQQRPQQMRHPPPPPQQQPKERKALVVVSVEEEPVSLKDQNPFDLDTSLYEQTTPYTIMVGNVIPITILTPIYSDLPGQVTAVVSRDVYDSVTQTHKLIPQGTIVVGPYDHEVNVGQKRVVMAWEIMNFPNGWQKYLAGQQGADLAGMAGVGGNVNRHLMEVFGTAIALSVIGTGAQMAQQPTYNNNNPYGSSTDIAAQQLGMQLGRTSNQLLQQGLNRPPTIEVPPGTQATVVLKQNLVFPSPYPFQGGSHVQAVREVRGSHRPTPTGVYPTDHNRRASGGDQALPRRVSEGVQPRYRPEESHDLAYQAGVSQESFVPGREEGGYSQAGER